jgi:hypothetical protein
MTGQRPPDDRVLAWIHSGPETAPSEFVERTLRPVPRMRQRRSWRVGLEHVGGPLLRPVALGLAIILVVGLVVASGIGRGPAPVPPPLAPTLELRLAPTQPEAAFTDTGPFVTDATATTNTCTMLPDGFWKVDYSGGAPYVRVALLVGPEGATDGRSEAASGEIVIGSPLTTLLNFDQPGYRSGDAPGRSTAIVETTTGTESITFDITATTPRKRIDFSDYPYSIDIDLTVVCPT